MRSRWAAISTVVGAGLVAVGLGGAWYYAAVVYPSWLARYWKERERPPGSGGQP